MPWVLVRPSSVESDRYPQSLGPLHPVPQIGADKAMQMEVKFFEDPAGRGVVVTPDGREFFLQVIRQNGRETRDWEAIRMWTELKTGTSFYVYNWDAAFLAFTNEQWPGVLPTGIPSKMRSTMSFVAHCPQYTSSGTLLCVERLLSHLEDHPDE